MKRVEFKIWAIMLIRIHFKIYQLACCYHIHGLCMCVQCVHAINITIRVHHGGWVTSLIDSRCQSFTARRGPVVHLADLVVARSIIGCAARPSSALRYNILDFFSFFFFATPTDHRHIEVATLHLGSVLLESIQLH